jgi:hypothetical protein
MADKRNSEARSVSLTGGYYWFPTPTIGSLTWQVLTCHELGCDAEVGHVDLWTLVIDRLATAWRREGRFIQRSLKNNYTGLPRGRVTQVKNRFMILHGNDSPVPDWVPMVMTKFELNRRSVIVLFDEHERMLPEDRRSVSKALGLLAGQDGTARGNPK